MAWPGGGDARRGGGFWGVLVEWDPEADLDVPAGDADFVDDEAEQFLALVEVESVECGGGRGGEGVDSLA